MYLLCFLYCISRDSDFFDLIWSPLSSKIVKQILHIVDLFFVDRIKYNQIQSNPNTHVYLHASIHTCKYTYMYIYIYYM